MAGEMIVRKIVGIANKIADIEYIKRLIYSANGTGVIYAHVPS